MNQIFTKRSARKFQRYFGILAFVFLAGCATLDFLERNQMDPMNYTQVKKAISFEHDAHEGWHQAIGPTAGFDPYDKNLVGGANKRGGHYFLRAFPSSSNGKYGDKSRVQIYVLAILGGWAFLNEAYSEGKKYSTTLIDKEKVQSCKSEGGCIVHEEVAVNLTLGQIKKEILNKPFFIFKLTGKRGSVVVKVPQQYFQAFVDKLEAK